MGATEERLNPLKMRIVIIGSTGSGKSALAARLAAKLQISHTELDNLHWLQDWHERPDTEFRELVDVATPQSAWVIDSGYPVLRDLVWGRADVIIWLNYSFATTAGSCCCERFGGIRKRCRVAMATTSRSSVR